MPKTYTPHKNLFFHSIDNNLFVELMKRCKGYISTAGFDSICEAMYLQKPVFMVPVKGQYEQGCNAIDGEIAGAGIRGSSFDISLFMNILPYYSSINSFHAWVNNAKSIFLEELTNL